MRNTTEAHEASRAATNCSRLRLVEGWRGKVAANSEASCIGNELLKHALHVGGQMCTERGMLHLIRRCEISDRRLVERRLRGRTEEAGRGRSSGQLQTTQVEAVGCLARGQTLLCTRHSHCRWGRVLAGRPRRGYSPSQPPSRTFFGPP